MIQLNPPHSSVRAPEQPEHSAAAARSKDVKVQKQLGPENAAMKGQVGRQNMPSNRESLT